MFNNSSLIVFVLVLLFGCSVKEKAKPDDIADVNTVAEQANDLPDMNIKLTDSQQISAKELKGAVALIFFQPDCDHCQREAEDIRNNAEGFKGYTIYFVSSAPISEIEQFRKLYKLDQRNFIFGQADSQSVVANYGAIEVPSLYLYRSGKLIQSFNGEVAIEVVLKYLN
jgi:peroxiredoxin